MPEPTHHVRLAVNEQNNVHVSVSPAHPDFPPMALPGREFPTARSATEYTEALLRACRVIPQDYPYVSLVFVGYGHTIVNGQRYAALSAPLFLRP